MKTLLCLSKPVPLLKRWWLDWFKMQSVQSFLKGMQDCMGWLVNKNTPHTASSLLKLKSEFHNNKLDSIKKGPDEWISTLGKLQIWMSKFRLRGTDEDFMIYVLNNIPMECNVILDVLKISLTSSGDDTLTVKVIQEKLNCQYKKIKTKMKKKKKRKGLGSL